MPGRAVNKGHFILIDNLYTYGMLLVVLGHVGVEESFSQSYLFKWIYGFHMPLFFWIAGFLFCNSGGGKLSLFITKKAKRLLIPLIALTSLVFLPKVMLSQYASRAIEGGFQNYFYTLIYPDRNPIQLLWFLNALFGVYILGWISNVLCRDKVCRWFISAALSGYFYYLFPDIKLLGISSILYYFPYFCIGVIVRYKLHTVVGYLKKYHILDNPIVLSVIITTLYSVAVIWPVNKYVLATLGVSAATALMWSVKGTGRYFLPYLRPYTFTIYLLQWFPMVAIRIICYNHLHWNMYLCSCLMFVTGVLVPAAIGRTVLKHVPATGAGQYVRLSLGL